MSGTAAGPVEEQTNWALRPTRIEEYVARGATYFVMWFPDYPSHSGLELFATEVLPHFADR